MKTEKDEYEKLKAFMPDGWEAQAKELGALRRIRKVKSTWELLKLILLYLTATGNYKYGFQADDDTAEGER